MTGYWKLKPSEQLDAWNCFTIDKDNVTDFITYSKDIHKPTYELSDSEKEHILNQIREGYIEGQWDDSE